MQWVKQDSQVVWFQPWHEMSASVADRDSMQNFEKNSRQTCLISLDYPTSIQRSILELMARIATGRVFSSER